MKYVIFTRHSGYVFYICYTEAKGYFVSNDAPDNEVLTLPDKEVAEKIAANNTGGPITYEVKEIKLCNQ